METQIKVTIFDDRNEFGLKWASAMKKAGIFTNVKKENADLILKCAENDSPDFIIISNKSIGLIRQIRSVQSKNFMIIVFSENYTLSAEQSVRRLGADEFIAADITPEQLIKRIKLMNGFKAGDSAFPIDTTKNIEYIVTDVISRIGIPANIKGYYYLRTAVILTLADNKSTHSITKYLYPAIAKQYDTTDIKVERAIRHAIDVAWEKNSREYFIETFGYVPFQKPTNSEVISTISDRLKLKYYPSIGIL